MLDPENNLLPPPSSPTISSISSSDLDTESTGSFFHDRSTTLGTLMGVNFPAIAFRDPSQRREANAASAGEVGPSSVGIVVRGGGRRRSKKAALAALAERRSRRWWWLCRDNESTPSSLGEFLEVERRLGDGAFFGATAELEGVGPQPRNGRLLFADGRVLPPPPPHQAEDAPPSTAGAICRFPVSLTGICSGGAG